MDCHLFYSPVTVWSVAARFLVQFSRYSACSYIKSWNVEPEAFKNTGQIQVTFKNSVFSRILCFTVDQLSQKMAGKNV